MSKYGLNLISSDISPTFSTLHCLKCFYCASQPEGCVSPEIHRLCDDELIIPLQFV